MRLYCFSDLHQRPFPVCEPPPDAWLFAGDLYDKPRRELTDRDIAFRGAARTWLDARAEPVHAVRGNHDVNDKAGFFAACEDLTEGRFSLLEKNLVLAGLGWAGDAFYQLPTEEQLKERCFILQHWAPPPPARLILLTHYPPHDPQAPAKSLFRDGFYFDCVRKLMEAIEPIAVIAGHTHDDFGKVASLSGATVVFPGPVGKLLTISESGRVSVE